MAGRLQVRAGKGRMGAAAGVLLLLWVVAGCGGGSGGNGEPAGVAEVYPSAVSLVDGKVGDSPFSDDGSANGLADGHSLLEAGGLPVTVRWSPVTRQVDATPETELAGYRVYYGARAGVYDYVVEIGDPSVQSYRLAGLPDGTWYFAVSAVDGANREGPLSIAVSIRTN